MISIHNTVTEMGLTTQLQPPYIFMDAFALSKSSTTMQFASMSRRKACVTRINTISRFYSIMSKREMQLTQRPASVMTAVMSAPVQPALHASLANSVNETDSCKGDARLAV